MESKWVKKPSQMNHDQATLDPMPSGPYVHVSQHDVETFKLRYMTMKHDFEREFREPKWGHVVFAVTLSGEPKMVAYHYDTGD